MPVIHITADMELHEGFVQRVSYRARTGRGRGQWVDLKSGEWDGHCLHLPEEHFAHSAKVPDVVVGHWNSRERSTAWLNRISAADGVDTEESIVVVVESPHKSEYTWDESEKSFRANGALANSASRARLRTHFDRLIRDAMVKTKTKMPHRAPIIVRNPVQFQASLHNLLDTTNNDRLRRSIRNATWRGLWRFQYGESHPIQQDFPDRLASSGTPALILNACTHDLRDEVGCLLRSKAQSVVVTASAHVSVWDRNTHLWG